MQKPLHLYFVTFSSLQALRGQNASPPKRDPSSSHFTQFPQTTKKRGDSTNLLLIKGLFWFQGVAYAKSAHTLNSQMATNAKSPIHQL